MRSLTTRLLPLVLLGMLAAPSGFAQSPSASGLLSVPAAGTAPAAVPAAANQIVVPEAPYGTCPFNMQQQADTKAMAYIHLGVQGKAKLLGVYGDCAQLEALRGDVPSIAFLNSYVTLIEQEGNTVNFNRASTILTLASSIGMTSAFSSASTQSQRTGFSTREPSYHGILQQTADFIIVGAEQRHVARQIELGVAVVSVITVIKGKIVTANFFVPMSDGNSFGRLAGRAEAYARALIAANP